MGTGLLNQTTPANGIPGTSSKVQWNPSSEFLVWTIKGSPTNNSTGKFVYFGWNRKTNSFNKPVVTSLPEIMEPFGFQFLSNNEIWVADAVSGGALVTFNSEGQASLKYHTVISDQILTCWTNWDPARGHLYLMDGGSPNFYQMSMSGDYLATYNTGLDYGNFDTASINGLLYTLSGTTEITVIDPSNNKVIQYYSLNSTIPNRQYYVGMQGWTS